MKRLALLTIPVIAAVAISSATAISASAATVYPESDDDFIRPLTFSSLTDYSIEDELFAFADGNSVKLYENGKYGEYPFKAKVTAVDIEESVIYCLSGGMTYYLDYEKNEFYPYEEDPPHTFDGSEKSITCGDYVYYINPDGMNVLDTTKSDITTHPGDFFNLKKFGDEPENEIAYAICDNTLYSFTGTAMKALDDLKYMIDASDVEIAVGQAKTELKTYSSARFVTIAEGAVMTEIDLDNIPADGNFTSKDIIMAAPGSSALYLCETGDFTIVSILDKAYAVLSTNISFSALSHRSESPFNKAQTLGNEIHASPFLADGTISHLIESVVTVNVIAKVEFEGVLENVFYEVEFEWRGETIHGFVAKNLLTNEVREDSTPSNEHIDQEYSEANNTKTILIIFAVVVLVLAVLAYVLHVTMKGKFKGKKKKQKAEDEEK